ncbi:MAG: cation:proton antiporter [Myxococcota bacterium]
MAATAQGGWRCGACCAVAWAASALVPARAWAAGGDPGGTAGGSGSLSTVVLLVVVIGVAYVLAHNFVERLQRRFLVVSGLEYLLLGFLLGPAVPAVRAFDDLTGLLPVIALAAGWVGLLRGTDFDFASLQKLDPATWRIFFLHHVIPGVAVGFGSFYVFQSGLLIQTSESDAALSAAALGCFAATDSAEPFDLLARRYKISGRLSPLLRNATRLGDIAVILAFGLIFCIWHQNAPDAEVLGPALLAWITLALGSALGILFSVFLAGDESDNSRFLALVGIIAFASGGAYFLELSPLAVNLIMGLWLVNTARGGQLLHSTLVSTERPMTLVLLIFAGALWTPSPWVPTVIAVVAFIVVRTAAKWIASIAAGWGTSVRNDLFRGLLAHGDVTLAMAVSFRLVYEGPAVDIAYSVILCSIIFNDLLAPRLLRGLLVDAGDLQDELKESDTSLGVASS